MKQLNEMTIEELGLHMTDVFTVMRMKAYEQGKKDATSASEFTKAKEILNNSKEQIEIGAKRIQAERDRIVEMAKDEVRRFQVGIFYCVEFIVNKEKRTVVALLKDKLYGVVHSRGIAKCQPQDCFNVHIGKIIALRRALGLKVPDEYINTPQPTEVKVGDVIEYRWFIGQPEVETEIVMSIEGDKVLYESGDYEYVYKINKVDSDKHSIRITDDSREDID